MNGLHIIHLFTRGMWAEDTLPTKCVIAVRYKYSKGKSKEAVAHRRRPLILSSSKHQQCVHDGQSSSCADHEP